MKVSLAAADPQQAVDLLNIYLRESRQDVTGTRTQQFERSPRRGQILEYDVIHNDEFVERGKSSLTHPSMGKHENAVIQGKGFDFRENVPLGRQKKTDGPLPWFEVPHIGCQDGIQVAVPVRP